MKQTVNRMLRAGLSHAAKPSKPRRFVVKPIDTGITRAQWDQWGDRKIEDVLEEAERSERAERSSTE